MSSVKTVAPRHAPHHTHHHRPKIAATPASLPAATDSVAEGTGCAEVLKPQALLGRLMDQTKGHIRADLHLRQATTWAIPGGAPMRVVMPKHARGALMLDFENIAGKPKLVGGSFELKERMFIKNLGDLQNTGRLRRIAGNKAASFELTGFKIDSSGVLTPQGTVLLFKRIALHRYDGLIPTFDLNTLARKKGHHDGLSPALYEALQSALKVLKSGTFKLDTKSRLGEEVLLDAGKITGGNETYVGIDRTAISGDLQGRFKTHNQGLVLDICPPQRTQDRTVSFNTAEVDVSAHIEAQLEKRRTGDKGGAKNMLGVAVFARDTTATIKHLNLGLRGEPTAPTNSGRVVGGTAWRTCGYAVPAVVVRLDRLEGFLPAFGSTLRAAGRIDLDAALSFVEPVDPNNVLAAHARSVTLAYDGKLDAHGDILLTQPSGDPEEPPVRMIQHINVVRSENLSGNMEPLPDDEQPGTPPADNS